MRRVRRRAVVRVAGRAPVVMVVPRRDLSLAHCRGTAAHTQTYSAPRLGRHHTITDITRYLFTNVCDWLLGGGLEWIGFVLSTNNTHVVSFGLGRDYSTCFVLTKDLVIQFLSIENTSY